MTALMMSWILAVCTGFKVAAYLSDITGAFDRVFRDYMLAKLYNAGIGTKFLNFLASYLKPRKAVVVVEGIESDETEIADQVFQGTVLGPPLWNTFFADVVRPASSSGGRPSIFADDLNVFQEFDRTVPNEEYQQVMMDCRAKVHRWGKVNRAVFDADKEHIIVLHPLQGEGEPFKLLGCLVDCKLIMQNAVDKMLTQIRPKVKAILRTRAFYAEKDLIAQFKTHIWGLMECHNGGIFHASTTVLEKLDAVHYKFLRDIGIHPNEAFLNFNFGPPNLRRNIGILGLLHKRVLGLSHPMFQSLLPFASDVPGAHDQNGHSRQLYSHLPEVHFQLVLFCRSIFAMTYVYNKLPQEVIDCKTVSSFQSSVTKITRKACENGDPDWANFFSCRK